MSEKIAEKIIEIMDELEEDGKRREVMEFVIAYENGLNWFENFKPQLNYRYNEFIKSIKREDSVLESKIYDDMEW